MRDPRVMAGKWRVGRHLGRTLYAQSGPSASSSDIFFGTVDDPAIAQYICSLRNTPLPHDELEEFVSESIFNAPDGTPLYRIRITRVASAP